MATAISAVGRSIIHIGPPKTATTSLQESVIPFLGRPYQVQPTWVHRVTRDPIFEKPADAMPSNLIVSDERLGTFLRQSPAVTAERLSKMFRDAVVIYVLRNPIELFYSAYRQSLMNFIDAEMNALRQHKSFGLPPSADHVFEAEWTKYRKFGVGFFAMINLHKIRQGFERYFTFETVEFDLLKTSPSAFVAAFTRACGNEMELPLIHANRADREVVEDALARLPDSVPETARTHYRAYYEFPKLSRAREDFLRNWKYSAPMEEFAKAFRF